MSIRQAEGQTLRIDHTGIFMMSTFSCFFFYLNEDNLMHLLIECKLQESRDLSILFVIISQYLGQYLIYSRCSINTAFIHSIIQQIFIECLPCACKYIEAGNIIKEVRKTKVTTFMELFSCRGERNSQKNLTNECKHSK